MCFHLVGLANGTQGRGAWKNRQDKSKHSPELGEWILWNKMPGLVFAQKRNWGDLRYRGGAAGPKTSLREI